MHLLFSSNIISGFILQEYPNYETDEERAVSRLRRTNDRSVPSVHEDHEDDENAENGVVHQSSLCYFICL
jgi:hypothetical protein